MIIRHSLNLSHKVSLKIFLKAFSTSPTSGKVFRQGFNFQNELRQRSNEPSKTESSTTFNLKLNDERKVKNFDNKLEAQIIHNLKTIKARENQQVYHPANLLFIGVSFGLKKQVFSYFPKL